MSGPIRLENAATGQFWEIERQGDDIVSRHGAIGSEGQTQRVTIMDGVIRARIARRVVDKLAHGYRPVGGGDASVDLLIAALRQRPDDGELAQVLADAWIAQGDPRGEVIALEHALATAPDIGHVPEREAALLASVRALPEGLLLQPGGFPFRERWACRKMLNYQGDGEVPQLRGDAMFRRMVRFLDRFSDALGPELVYFARSTPRRQAMMDYVRDGRVTPDLAPADAAFIDSLAADNALVGWNLDETPWTRFEPVTEPINEAMVRAFDAAYAIEPTAPLAVSYGFDFTYPDSDVRLPYQDRAYYLAFGLRFSILNVYPYDSHYTTQLWLPFDGVSDGALDYIRQLSDGLGQPLDPRGWSEVEPTADGRDIERHPLHIEL